MVIGTFLSLLLFHGGHDRYREMRHFSWNFTLLQFILMVIGTAKVRFADDPLCQPIFAPSSL